MANKVEYKKAEADPAEALEFYARNTRKKIYTLFPLASDGTTIINGTIFVTESGEANLSQSILFGRVLNHLHKYGEEFGSFTKIDKQFKTKLYASFLQQEVEALGQYFTPRKIIRSVIRMTTMDTPSFQFAGKRICDPFCGVGGFLLELLNMNESMMGCYAPNRSGKISLPFIMHGFDKGFERDDERTIILAKANMLIYLAELLFKNPACSEEFSRIFNETFALFKDNLGTFGHIIHDEAEKYDIILSNPPYVTSGSSIIKEEIRKTAHTVNEYPINALGLESISLEWIIKSLKKGGRAFVIVPDGILARVNMRLRNYILQECYLDAIVSLPIRTFFANSEHTYILAITKKNFANDVQTDPVFTYLVSNIGEKLTSVKREEIDQDDTPEMENLFRSFMASKSTSRAMLERQSGRCKIQNISRFLDESHWVIDRWWTREERVDVGAEEVIATASRAEVESCVSELMSALADYDEFLTTDPLAKVKSQEVNLGNTKLFRIFIGKRVLRKDVTTDTTDIPVYSANVVTPMGYVEKGNLFEFDHPAILWGIDGNFEFNLIPAGQPFATTDHCGTIQILTPSIIPEYLLCALHERRIKEDFERSFRASLSNMRKFVIRVPINKNGTFDMKAQKLASKRFAMLRQKKTDAAAAKKRVDEMFSRYIATA